MTLITKQDYQDAIKIVRSYEKQQKELKKRAVRAAQKVTPESHIQDCRISGRLRSLLVIGNLYDDNASLAYISKIDEQAFRGYRNIGEGTIDELKGLLASAGLKLKQIAS
jgi:hypothetical protein